MFFSMNYRKRTPAGIIHNAQVMDNPRSMQLQVAHVPVVKAVDSCIAKVIKKDESYEVREMKEKSEKKRIIYTIGDEEENHEKEMKEHENIPVPILEEPVIETLSAVVFPVCNLPSIIEEESESKEEVDSVPQESIEHVQQIQEVKKKKRRTKGVRK
jgi:hypothetical protein